MTPHGWAVVRLCVLVVVAAFVGLFAAYLTTAYVDTVAGDPERGCAAIYLEVFEDGEVVSATRRWLPPAVDCKVRWAAAPGEVVRRIRPDPAVFVVLALLDGLAVWLAWFTLRRARRFWARF